jgi:hypothetical protein
LASAALREAGTWNLSSISVMRRKCLAIHHGTTGAHR